jgi:hypothetical protein
MLHDVSGWDGVSYGCVAVWRPVIYNAMTPEACPKFLAAMLAALLLRILELSGSNFGPEKDYLG